MDAGDDDSAAYSSWHATAEACSRVMSLREKAWATSCVGGAPSIPQAVEIAPGFLWLGSALAAADEAFLRDRGITRLLNCADSSARGATEGREYLELGAEDDEDYELIERHLPVALAFLRAGPGPVLVHCHAGMNRSAAIVVAYLMSPTAAAGGGGEDEGKSQGVSPSRRRMTLDEAAGFVLQRRPIALSNESFVRQLAKLEARLGAAETAVRAAPDDSGVHMEAQVQAETLHLSDTGRDDKDWLRAGKWQAFYAGSFAPHLGFESKADDSPVDHLPWRSKAPTEQLVEFIASGGVPPGARCCELGCGTGENLVHLATLPAASVSRVVGVDVVEAAVEASAAALQAAGVAVAHGSTQASRSGDRCIVLCADILTLHQEDCQGPFDFLLDVQTFHCLRKVDALAAAKAYESLLAPGGVLLMLTGNAEELEERGPERLSREEVVHAFDGTSLKCESVEAFHFEWTDAYRRHGLPKPPLGWRSLWRLPKQAAVKSGAFAL